MALVAFGDEVHHHEPALRDGEVEIGGLADDRRVDLAGRRDGLAHGGVLGLLAEAEDHQQAAGVEAARVEMSRAAQHHRRDRGLGVARAAAVETAVLDHGAERIAGPAHARRHDVEMGDERDRAARARGP